MRSHDRKTGREVPRKREDSLSKKEDPHSRLLIICNNILSNTDNNGKTILSFIEDIPQDRVAQLYIDERYPEIEGYSYFKLSDKDIIRGILDSTKRGREMTVAVPNDRKTERLQKKIEWRPLNNIIPKNALTQFARELIWNDSWKSHQLNRWLEKNRPTIVLFVGGDVLFTYDICDYIVNKFKCRLATYITDDYLYQTSHAPLRSLRSRMIRTRMQKMINNSDVFFTISEKMRREYNEIFHKDSIVIHNIPKSLRDDVISESSKKNKRIHFLYAGNHYYGRLNALIELGRSLDKYNEVHQEGKQASLDIFFNMPLKKKEIDVFKTIQSVRIHAKIDEERLRVVYNRANILVFVESFDPKQIQKVRLSFSTKIPEYLSMQKPIFAIGPEEVNSMDSLKEGAFCVCRPEDISKGVYTMLSKYKKNPDLLCSRKGHMEQTEEGNNSMRSAFREAIGL